MAETRRGIDHLVLAVRDLDAAEGFFDGLGFTLTPRAHHPFGTANNLAIFDGNFLEILGVARPEDVPPHDGARFSVAAHIASFVERREGLSFLVLDSVDARADHAAFQAQGLPTYEPVDFSRGAVQPDGSEETVSFSIVFVIDPGMVEAPLFVCQQHTPQHFWKAAFQKHVNTARRIAAVTLAAHDPRSLSGFYAALFGAGAVSERDGAVSVKTSRGLIEIVAAADIPRRYKGLAVPLPPTLPAFVGMQIAVADMEAAARALTATRCEHQKDDGMLRVAPAQAFGTVVEFVRAE